MANKTDTAHYNTCVVCGKPFRTSPSDPQKCCSYECYQKLKQDILESDLGKRIKKALMQGSTDYLASHEGATHHAAKTYIMASPIGELVKVTNLKYWCYNSGIFEEPYRAYRNFMNISGTIQGTSHRQPQYSYNGWRIAFVDDTDYKTHKPVPKICPICGNKLPPQKKTYCSDECKAEGRRRRERANWATRKAKAQAKKEQETDTNCQKYETTED